MPWEMSHGKTAAVESNAFYQTSPDQRAMWQGLPAALRRVPAA
jgi:hypothetical protein